MTVRLPVALLLLTLSGCARLLLPPDVPLARPLVYRGTFSTYASGLRVVVQEAPRATRVRLDVSYRVGATDEPRGKEGLAHLVEHLTFLARHGGPQAPQLASRLLASGADFNASTTHDDTVYWSTAPVTQLGPLVELESQRLRSPLAHLTEADFLREREVVVAELRQRQETSPEGAQSAKLLATALPGHPYGRPAGGTPESVRRLTLEDVHAFVRQHYTPAHAVVVVSGPLPPAALREAVMQGFQAHLGEDRPTFLPPVQRTPPPMPEEPEKKRELVVETGPVLTPRLWLTWPVPGRFSGKTPQALAAAELLEAMLSRNLAQDERIHAAFVFTDVMDGVTLITVGVELARQQDALKVAEKVQDQLIVPVMDKGWTGAGTGFALGRLLTDTYREWELLPNAQVARFLRATGRADYVSAWQQQLSEELSSTLQPYLYEYLRRERTRVLLVVPGGTAVSATQGQAFTPLRGPGDVEHWDVPLPPGARDVRGVAQPPGLHAVERFTLPSGLEVVALRREGTSLVEARLLLRTGLAGEGGRAVLLPRAALQTSWGSAWLHAWRVGAHVQTRVAEDHAGVVVSAASGNLPHVLDDLGQWSMQARANYSFFARDWYARQLAREATLPHTRAEQAMRARLFPGHGYGASPTEAEARALTDDDAEAWLERHLRPEHATLLLVGELPPLPELRKQVEGLMGGWHGSPHERPPGPAPSPEPPLPSARNVVVVDRPGAGQADLHLGLRWRTLEAGQEATADTLTSLLQERLQRQLREQLGLTYGVQVATDVQARAATLHVRTAVDARSAAGTLEQVLAELGTLEDSPLADEVVERARWQVARGYDLRFRTVAATAAQLERLYRLGRAQNHWETYPDHLASVTPGSVQALVRQLHLGKETVVLTGDAATLRPPLEAAGFRVEVLAAP
jgi:zinc protease